MDMENNGLENDEMTQPTGLLICSNSVDELVATDAGLQNTAGQISTITEKYHFVDQNMHTIHYEIQALPVSSPQMMILTSESENGQVFHVIPSSQSGTAQLIIPQGQVQDSDDSLKQNQSNDNLQVVAGTSLPENAGSFIIHSNPSLAVSKTTSDRLSQETFQTPLQPEISNIPVWARRLRGCERIGDSYRGYCLSEAELMNILGLHKQHTQSVWGTRQSPSPAKPATRLMWKSQYVPYDGIPFVNAGSRAIVMECQYGPRRKGAQPKKNENEIMSAASYKATCPARIYIKKVKKFPNYRVPTDPLIDKKLLRMEQEKAFNLLKKDLEGTDGVLRWYVQLPDQDAHQYHDLESGCFSPSSTTFQPSTEEEEEMLCEESTAQPSRLHPRVAGKIRDLVSRGIDEVYSVRKQLRKFVERELFNPYDVPERHNLSYFPTVNDLKNHIHEMQRSLANGDILYDPETISGGLQWTSDNGNDLNEIVTGTYEAPPQEVSEQETPAKNENPPAEDICQDTAQLITSLTSLQPKIFAQLQGLQLQPSFTSSDGKTALITVNPPAPSCSSAEGKTALITVNPSSLGCSSCFLNPGGNSQPLLLSHMHNPQTDSPVSTITTLSTPAHNLVNMGQIVKVEDAVGVAGEVHQILLGGIHPIPIRIVENQPTIVEVNPTNTFCTESVGELKKETSNLQSHVLEDKSTDCQDPAGTVES
ncbi:calcium-responsive transcription factor [Rhinophrynus dorsalis]